MISVCMTSYNGEKYIKQQICSILSQLSQQDELIVSDDGSTDSTIQIIKDINDPRIRMIEGPRNHSIIDNFEHVLHDAKGDIIFTADQDDIWHPQKVDTCLKYLQEADCVISDCQVVNSNLEIIYPSFYAVNNTRYGKWYNLLIHNGYLGCCMAFKKEILQYALPFPPQIPQHDIWLGNVAAFKFKTLFINNKLIDYRRHENNKSTTSEKSRSTIVEKFHYRWNIIKGLINIRKK